MNDINENMNVKTKCVIHDMNLPKHDRNNFTI